MNETDLTYKQHIWTNNYIRYTTQEKLFDYYIGNERQILSYLNTALAITFSTDDIIEFQKDWINITKKVVNQLATVYKQPAVRYIIKEDGSQDETQTETYIENLPSNVNTIDKMSLRYAKLFNTSLTKVQVKNYNYNNTTVSSLCYEVMSSHLFDVTADDDDPYKIKQLTYDKYFKDDNGKDELYNVVWTSDQHYKRKVLETKGIKSETITIYSDPIPIGNNTAMINPYKVIPFAVNRLEMQGDFWGSGMCDLINSNEQINFLLTDLINGGVIMGSWGTLVATNMGFTSQGAKIKIGPRHPLAVDKVTSDSPADAKYINSNPLIIEVMGVIDWKIKLIALTKGLNPNSFLQDVKATSGYSKIIDSLEQMEIRQDDIEPCRQYEDERFEITKAVVNYEVQNNNATLNMIPGDSYLQVDFEEISIPKTVDEQQKEDEFDLQHNIISVVDIVKRRNPDLNEDEILQQIKNNAQIKKDLQEIIGIVPVVNSQQQNNNPVVAQK